MRKYILTRGILWQQCSHIIVTLIRFGLGVLQPFTSMITVECILVIACFVLLVIFLVLLVYVLLQLVAFVFRLEFLGMQSISPTISNYLNSLNKSFASSSLTQDRVLDTTIDLLLFFFYRNGKRHRLWWCKTEVQKSVILQVNQSSVCIIVNEHFAYFFQAAVVFCYCCSVLCSVDILIIVMVG